MYAHPIEDEWSTGPKSNLVCGTHIQWCLLWYSINFLEGSPDFLSQVKNSSKVCHEYGTKVHDLIHLLSVTFMQGHIFEIYSLESLQPGYEKFDDNPGFTTKVV